MIKYSEINLKNSEINLKKAEVLAALINYARNNNQEANIWDFLPSKREKKENREITVSEAKAMIEKNPRIHHYDEVTNKLIAVDLTSDEGFDESNYEKIYGKNSAANAINDYKPAKQESSPALNFNGAMAAIKDHILTKQESSPALNFNGAMEKRIKTREELNEACKNSRLAAAKIAEKAQEIKIANDNYTPTIEEANEILALLYQIPSPEQSLNRAVEFSQKGYSISGFSGRLAIDQETFSSLQESWAIIKPKYQDIFNSFTPSQAYMSSYVGKDKDSIQKALEENNITHCIENLINNENNDILLNYLDFKDSILASYYKTENTHEMI